MERHVMNLSKELVRLGHRVDIFTSNGVWEGKSLPKSCVVEGMDVRRFRPVMSLGDFGKVWPGFAPALISGGYDVIHSHVFRHPHTDISNMVSKLSGAKSVLTSHSPFHPSGVRKSMAEALVPLYDAVIAPASLKAFDRIISLTPAEAGTLSTLSGDGRKIRIIPHGVEDIHFSPVSTEGFRSRFGLGDSRIVLYLGRMHPTKGLYTLVEAFGRAAKAVQDAVLVLAGPSQGDGGDRYVRALRLLADSLGVGGRVVFTSRLTEEEKRVAYQSCEFFVLPSLYEPYGIVLLEAAAHAKPMIASRTDGPLSIVREGTNGYLFNPGDAAELAGLMELLLSDDGLRKKLGAGARVLAAEHRWDRVGAETVSAYLTA